MTSSDDYWSTAEPLEGWLLKKGEQKTSAWQRRYFREILAERKLYYFDNDTIARPTAAIDLRRVQSLASKEKGW